MKKTSVSLFLLLMLVISVRQNSFGQGRFEIEVDPSTFVLKGYSFHAGYQVSKSRFNLGTYAFELPGVISGTKGFIQKNQAIQVKYDYLFTGAKGWYAGAQLDFTRKNIEEKETDLNLDFDRLVVGARVGYRFMFGREEKDYRGFYLSPWAGFLANINPIETTITTKTYKEKPLIPFATVHLGWRF